MRLNVLVKPSSGRQEIRVQGSECVACLKSPPEKGKANRELLLLEKRFKKRARLISGHCSRRKAVELE